VLVAPFSARLGAITGPTDDRTTVLEAIEAIKPGGGTAILDVLAEMSRRLPATDGEGRRVLVLLTDGYDENSRSTPDAALADVRASGATLYTVGIGGIAGISLRGERMLRRLAGETGGRSFFPPREADLDPTYDLLVADAQNRYLLSYTPTNQVADGTWRAITVRTVPEPLRIRARNGYQAPSPPPVRPSFEFTVTDLAQQYTDVTVDDLEVVEDGVRQTVESFQEAVLPVSIVLALDASGSMRRSADTVVQAARRFVESVRPQDSLAVVLFADQSVFAHDLSANRENSLAAIDSYVSAGGTALYDALSDSLIRLRRAEGRRVVVVMTDGRDENAASTGPGSRATFDRVRELARETGAIVFGIGLGTRVDRAPLEELARLTGGDAYFPTDVSELTDQYARIVENLRRRFVLSYTSTNARRDGSWRKVAIHSRLAGLQVKGPDGYFAPAQ
jgi:VWFA-related protein